MSHALSITERSQSPPTGTQSSVTRRGIRRGLSLLEVMLAIAILGTSLALVGELMRIGVRNAERARDLSVGHVLCESIFSEMLAGTIPPQSTTSIPVNDPQYQLEWTYTIAVEQVDQNGLLSVWVQVDQVPELFARPVSFQAVRWMPDPNAITTTTDTTSGATGTGTTTGGF